jgi:hydrogenase maturation protease
MAFKVIAMGNVLMKDDAIGIEVGRTIEEKLMEKKLSYSES